MLGCHSFRVFACLVPALLVAQSGRALDVAGTGVRLSWSAASGPVAGYDVHVSRGGGAFAVETRVAANAVQLAGAIGETLAVRVAAFDALGRRGPLSPLSESIDFVSPPPVSPPPGASPSADLDGNGRSDALAVELASGALNAVLLASDGSRRWVTIGTPRDAAMRPLGFADVDGDARADVIWRNASSGANELWLLRGLVYSVSPLPAQATRFKLAAFRDFTGDRKADALWHDAATGESQLWVLGAGGYQTALAVDGAPAGARLAAVCDVDGDRMPDLIWQYAQTRALEAWLMQGAVPRAVSSLGIAAAASSVVGVGDLDASGVEDLVWRRRTSSGYVLDVWFLARGGAPRVGVATKLASRSRLRGVVDLDANGTDDLVIGSWASVTGLAVLPVHVSGSTRRWQTQALSISGAASADWQFLTLD